MFPADNAWNQDISAAAAAPRSARRSSPTIQANGGDYLHPDFGENPDYGIPFVVVPGDQPLVPITYTAYGDESDPGPFPIPLDAPVEGGGARRRPPRARGAGQGRVSCSSCSSGVRSGAGWDADSGARFDLTSQRPAPARLDERRRRRSADPARSGALRRGGGRRDPPRDPGHVLARPSAGYILPATHFASSITDPELPADGHATAVEGRRTTSSQLTGQARVIAEAMQRYGLIVADNGATGSSRARRARAGTTTISNQLKAIPGIDLRSRRHRPGATP